MAMTSTPDAGWYPDSELPGQLRWWDGTTWTDRRRPDPRAAGADGAADVAPPADAVPPAAPTPPTPPPPAGEAPTGPLPTFGPPPGGPAASGFGTPPPFGTPPGLGVPAYGVPQDIGRSIVRRTLWILLFVGLSFVVTAGIIVWSVVSIGDDVSDAADRSRNTLQVGTPGTIGSDDRPGSEPGSSALDLPEGWPAALAPPVGGEVRQAAASGPQGPGRSLVVTLGSDDTVAEVEAAARAQLEGAGFTIEGASGAGETRTLAASGPQLDVSVVITPSPIPDQGATTTIWSLVQTPG